MNLISNNANETQHQFNLLARNVQNQQENRLNSAEIGSLWQVFFAESMVHHVFLAFLGNVDDEDTKSALLTYADMSGDTLKLLKQVFEHEGLPIPRGITAEDIVPNSPRLFSDRFYLSYLNNMVLYVISRAGLSYFYSSREDIRHFFSDLVDRLMLVGKQIKDLMISKGLHIHPPITPVPDKIDFVKKQKFMAGFFGDVRPLSVIEAHQLFYNAKQNAIGKALLMGFSQTARTKEIKQYFIQSRDLSNKYLGDINRILLNENIGIAPNYDGEVTTGTEGPFSERLMLLHTNFLISAGIQNIGTALSLSPRRDLAAMYTKMIAEIESLANAGTKLLIENGWMEEPPLAPDRDALVKTDQNQKNLAKDKLH